MIRIEIMDRHGHWQQLDQTHGQVRVTDMEAGVAVTMLDRDGVMDVRVDPVNGQAVSLDVQSVSAHDMQAQLRVRGSLEP